jgi:hypothetical protein
MRASHWRRRGVLYLLALAFAAPIVASYIAYYVVQPEGRTNYGTLIEPQRSVPHIPGVRIDGTDFDLRALKGKWVFVMVDSAVCNADCEAKLLHMRQQRTMAGKEVERIERVWFATDKDPVAPRLIAEYVGTNVVRTDERALRDFLALPAGTSASLRDHIWVVDPLGNLMLRWPKNPDPKGTKGDMDRLLKAASLWTRVERDDKP